MKVSVLIPVYNVAPYVDKCLKSVVSQTYQNLEVIIADDGSTDESGKICDEYASMDKRILVIHKKNEGLLQTRRLLFRKATGEVVLCLDSDDYLELDAIEIAVRYLEKENADMTFFGHDTVNEQNHLIKKYPSYAKDGTLFEGKALRQLQEDLILSEKVNYIWDKLFKRKLLSAEDDENPIYRCVDLGEDAVQMLPILERAKRIVYCDKCLYHYRKNNNSISKSFQFKYHNDMIKVAEERLRFIERYGLESEELYKLFYKTFYFRLVKRFYVMMESNKYSNQELKEHLHSLYYEPLVQEALKMDYFFKFNMLDKIVGYLFKKQKFLALIYLLKLEKKIASFWK